MNRLAVNDLDAVAQMIAGRVECLGGNVQGAIVRCVTGGTPCEIVVTDEGDYWLVSRCDDPDGLDDDHDHVLHDASIGPLPEAGDVPAAVDMLLIAASLRGRGLR